MKIKDIIFTPHNDMEISDLDTVLEHTGLIGRREHEEAAALLNENSYEKGFRASLLNRIQNKIRSLQLFLLNEFAAEEDEFYSIEEPDGDFMLEHGYTFWIKPDINRDNTETED